MEILLHFTLLTLVLLTKFMVEAAPQNGIAGSSYDQDKPTRPPYLLKAFPNPNKFNKASNLEVDPVNKTENGNLLKAVDFMKQFGYVPSGDETAGFIYTKESIKEKLKLVQKFGAIPQTGELDGATLKLMSSPRCGVRDVELDVGQRRRKRYIVGGSGWNKRKLTYHIANWSPQLTSKANVQRELKRAFEHWAKYSYLQFTEVQANDADIIIFFASYHHLDGYPFDGQGGILAHAYYPNEFGHYGGDIHFDESETWTINPPDEYSGLDFFTVAVHEIGHSLGLAHSPVAGSIMFPYYKGLDQAFHLDYDDVMGMWELYIRRRLDGDDEYFNTTTTTTTTTPPPPASTTDVYDGHQNDGKNGSSDADYDESDVRYHGDYETVDDHIKRHGSNDQPDLPALPPLFPDVTEAEEDEDDIYEKDRKRREEEQKKREEEAKRKREEEEAHRKWERERRRREEEDRIRREEEDRRRWEEEKREWERRWMTTAAAVPPAVAPSTPPPTEAPIPDICNGNFDSAAFIRDQLFIFKGKYMWRFYEKGNPVPGYPAKILNMFPELPYWLKKIDAVYERRNDSSIVFFIGRYYYVHDGSHLSEDSPRPLVDYGLSSLITQVDAALFWPKNNKTYLFCRNLYWRRNDFEDLTEENYPRSIEKWNGIPKYLDAALTDKYGVTFFFKDKDVFEYDNSNIRPRSNSPYDVRSWTNC